MAEALHIMRRNVLCVTADLPAALLMHSNERIPCALHGGLAA